MINTAGAIQRFCLEVIRQGQPYQAEMARDLRFLWGIPRYLARQISFRGILFSWLESFLILLYNLC